MLLARQALQTSHQKKFLREDLILNHQKNKTLHGSYTQEALAP